jgi:8-amino-7-oxononanoate synthase
MLQKYHALKQAHAVLSEGTRDPFGVTFDAIASPTEAKLGGRLVTLFGSNNYLGLTLDPGCKQQAAEALAAEGTGTSGSRIANGTYTAHTALEAQIARYLGKREAMLFTTGYQANLGMLSALAGRDDDLLLDADGHASIYDGARLSAAQVTRFRHNDPDDLYRRLKLLSSRPGQKLIVVEGIYSMLGDLAPLREIAAVKRETGAYLLVDEAHSLGVLGEHGRGLAELDGVEADVDYIVGTFSKSLGSIGGFCAADDPDFGLLRLASRAYMFTASLPPAIVASVSRALTLVESRPELRVRLMEHAHRLHAGLAAAGFSLGAVASPVVSIRMPDPGIAGQFWNKLLDCGFYVNLALPPATPASQSLLRMSVTAVHSEAQIEAVIASAIAIGRELGVLDRRSGMQHAAE